MPITVIISDLSALVTLPEDKASDLIKGRGKLELASVRWPVIS